MNEREIQQKVQYALGSRPDTRLWRQNAGKFFHVPRPCPSCRTQGRWVQGAPAGAADLSGIHKGRCLQIEVKADTSQSDDQRNWERMILSQGGIYILAHSADEALDKLNSS